MRRHLIASGLAVLMAASAPAISQAQQGMDDTARTADRDGGTNGEWGLLGLLGLAGLAGLRRREGHDDVTHHRTTHTAAR
jgi:MYXO-CTERM domain-containing protein